MKWYLLRVEAANQELRERLDRIEGIVDPSAVKSQQAGDATIGYDGNCHAMAQAQKAPIAGLRRALAGIRRGYA
jgi:hypothetical protein